MEFAGKGVLEALCFSEAGRIEDGAEDANKCRWSHRVIYCHLTARYLYRVTQHSPPHAEYSDTVLVPGQPKDLCSDKEWIVAKVPAFISHSCVPLRSG